MWCPSLTAESSISTPKQPLTEFCFEPSLHLSLETHKGVRTTGLIITEGRDRKQDSPCDMEWRRGCKCSQGVRGKPEEIRECFLDEEKPEGAAC